MVGAFRIHDDAIDPIDSDDRRVDRQRPERDPLECSSISFDICINQHEAAKQRLRLGRRHADMDACLSGSRVGRRHPSFRSAFGDHSDRLLKRNGGIRATNAIRRQIR